MRRLRFLVPILLVLIAALAAAKKDKRIGELPAGYQVWLETVELLISKEELAAFLELEKDYQRDAFIEKWWRIRDPYPDSTRNEFRDRYLNLIADAQELFGDLNEDRSQMLLMNGAPDGRIEFVCTAHTWPLEVWFYDGSEKIPHEFFLVFVKKYGGRRFYIFRPRDGIGELLDNLSNGVDQNFWFDLEACRDGDIVARVLRALLANPFEWDLLEARLSQPAVSPSPEWVATFESYSTDLPEGAAVFPAELALDFPERYQSRTVMNGTVKVDPTKVGKTELAGKASYNFVLSGEILRETTLFENFRYKFDFPAESVGTNTIPMSFQRRLRPGSYRLVLKLEDMSNGSFFRSERDIEVPVLDGSAPRPPPDAESAEIFAAATAALTFDATTLELIPPRGDMQSGMVRFDTLTTGDDIVEVVFSLNDHTALRKRRPPWSVEFDLGEVPSTHELRAVAFNAEGEQVATDELLINGGVHRFGVRLIEPLPGVTYTNEVTATADVSVPEDSVVERVEFYLNEDLAATLYQPPFTQAIRLPEAGSLGYVRAVAYRPDGNSTEDLVFINAPDYLEEVEVEFVELYTTVLDKQKRPVLVLKEEDFTAFEDGVQQQIVRFDLVKNLPIHAGIMLDVSASMTPHIEATKQAALRFFQETITPKDRAALFTFNDHPQLAMKFSNDVGDLAAGLAAIKAERGTALYDSLIFALYYFNGVKGQRVLLLLSDGKDESSRFEFEDAREYARRTGVSIYAIGLDIEGKGSGPAKKGLTQIAEETGGRSFFISDATELSAIYATIQEEIRSRYLIGYQSSNTDGSRAFREVEVLVEGPGLEPKAMRGYYP